METLVAMVTVVACGWFGTGLDEEKTKNRAEKKRYVDIEKEQNKTSNFYVETGTQWRNPYTDTYTCIHVHIHTHMYIYGTS